MVERTNSSLELVCGRSRVRIPSSNHSFIESKFIFRRGILLKRSFGARRCGDDRDSTSILRGNRRAEEEDQLEASSLNVSKAAGQGEMERKKIKSCIHNEAGSHCKNM